LSAEAASGREFERVHDAVNTYRQRLRLSNQMTAATFVGDKGDTELEMPTPLCLYDRETLA
jgi:hypothetical protein